MSENTIIEKTMKKYQQYGITKPEVKLLINMAKSFEIPQDAIYPGIQMVLNNQYGINEDGLFSEAMKALTADALLNSMNH